MKEFLDTDLAFYDLGLHSFFNVKFDVKDILGFSDAKTSKILRVPLSDLYTISALIYESKKCTAALN